ncbi:hypothetical protein FRC04_009879 [Tulasnella sp. 424]|nr:hypothetical protein FRC04_009879 [Tulasnella sp. 424]
MAQASISITQAYATLGLEKGADMDAVKKAYKEIALQTHPDKVPEERRAEATIEFQNVGAAYETITKHHQGPDSDDDEFDFGPGHMPHFHFGHGFDQATVDQERLRRQQEAEAERERAKLRRAEEERKAREQRERERDAKAKAAAARKAREEAKKELRNDPVAAAAAEEARRVEAEKRDREAARKVREALERPQRIRSTVFEAARKGNTAVVKKGVWEHNVDAAGPEVLPRASDLVKVRPADWNKLETLLHIAVSNGDKDLVEWLITHNAEPDERDSLGQTPFNRAVHLGDMPIIHYFLDEFPPDSEDSEPVLAAPQGDTTLRLAVASTNPTVVTIILNAGLINLSDAAATWAWIDEQEGQVTKKLGGKYDKVRDILRKIEGWTPSASPEARTNSVIDPESPSRGGFTQQQQKKNRNGGNQHQGQASAPASAEPPAATSNKPVEVPFTTRFNNSRGRGGRRGRGRGRP